MYRYYVPKRSPAAFWMLDDTVPFQEYSGVSASGGKKTGTSDPTKSVPLVCGAAFSSVFKAASVGQFTQNLFKVGRETKSFALEAWILPIPKTSTGDQQILSHGTIFDGLSINGKVIRFGTSYATTGDAFCTFDLQEYKLAYVVGIHTAGQNQLWVNNVQVASVDITDAQKADSYVAAADGNLYSGYTTSTQELAMNAVAFYPTLSGSQINQNYLAGLDTIGQARVISQYGGVTFALDSTQGSAYIDHSWVSQSDFNLGVKMNVDYDTDKIIPSYSNGLSLAGRWKCAVPLDVQGDTSIYGVMVEWSGNSITVDTSLDGLTWTAATNGALVSTISSGYNPTGKDLQIRVNFTGGLAVDPAYLESLRVIAFRDNSVNSSAARTVTVSSPAIVRSDYEPTLYRDDNGVNLHGGTLTIGTDTTGDPIVARTLELWIKPLSGTPTISVTGTQYRNGAAGSSMPVGEWSLVHIVAAANITSAITVTGDCIIGQATFYPTALTANDVAFIFNSYIGAAVTRLVDTDDSLSITEANPPYSIYAHDWSISAAG